ncbi:MAG: glycosyltransferase family 4 protein, partial [Flavobacteriaceae bacterium]|nr:glycosyltransferase family 4 protein [Flavobacteriaceae bacterium]
GQMRFMSKNGFDVTMISAGGEEIKEVIKNEECRHIILPLTRKITPIQDIKAVIKLLIYLKKEKPSIVHTHTPKAGIVGMLTSYLAGVPIRLHTVAGLPLMETRGLKRFILNFVEKLTYKCSTKVYPNSYGLKKIILKHRFTSQNKLKVIGNGSSNGIDTSYFDPKLFSIEENTALKTNLGIKKTDFVFIFVGRIVSDKGINELVEAFDKISLINENIKLLLVGPFEDDLDPLQKKTKLSINNNENIILAGYQNDVRSYFSISNCLVFPSYREGFPNVVMQAGAMKLPCIVSDINGCNEIIENNTNGLVIKVKSVNSIYNAMIKITSDKLLFNRLRLNSRDSIKIKYEREVYWGLLLKEYKYVLNKNLR